MLPLPPLTEDRGPLALLEPPPTEEYTPIAWPFQAPLIDDALPLALLWMPLLLWLLLMLLFSESTLSRKLELSEWLSEEREPLSDGWIE